MAQLLTYLPAAHGISAQSSGLSLGLTIYWLGTLANTPKSRRSRQPGKQGWRLGESPLPGIFARPVRLLLESPGLH